MGEYIAKIKCGKRTKADQTDKLAKKGIQFISAKNKHLRLYYQSQFSKDLMEEELPYLKFIFDQKTYLLFGSHYWTMNLIKPTDYLEEIFAKVEDLELKKKKITEEFKDDAEMNLHVLNYKIKTTRTHEFKTCRVNFLAKRSNEIPWIYNISPKIISDIKTTEEIQIYSFLTENTRLIYFVLFKIFNKYYDSKRSVKKLIIYQIGMKTIDEIIFTYLAYYIYQNPQIHTVSIYGKSLKDFRHLKDVGNIGEQEDEEKDQKDEQLVTKLQNPYHVFNLYQILARKKNLIELSVILFMDNYNLAMLANVIKENTGIKRLNVQNVLTHSTLNMDGELDFTYKEYGEIPDTIKDELFIFFNYLFNLEQLEELRLTNFRFMSDINFMAVQVARSKKNMRIFSLDKNQAIIPNDNVVISNYILRDLPLEELNMGFTYYHSVRRWDYIINVNTLIDLNVGIVDYTTFCALTKYIEKTNIEKCIMKLNRQVPLDSIHFFFEQISTGPFSAKNLKYFYVLNAFNAKLKKEKSFENNRKMLIKKLLENKTIRRIGFSKPAHSYFDLIDFPPYKSFLYIRRRDYSSAIYFIKAMRKLFKSYNPDNFKEGSLNPLIKELVLYRFTTSRKLIIE